VRLVTHEGKSNNVAWRVNRLNDTAKLIPQANAIEIQRGVRRPLSSVTEEERFKGEKRILTRNETTFGVFGRLLLEEADSLGHRLTARDKGEAKAWGIETEEQLAVKLKVFREKIRECTDLAEKGSVSRQDNPLFFRLRQAFVHGNVKELAAQIKYSFISLTVAAEFTPAAQKSQQRLADLRYPVEWYPATRAMQRTVHLHVGPTNSGKTYQALKRLEAAESGVYAGPLRLLAHEVYTRFNAKGKLCALVTGEEQRIPEGMVHHMCSCTVEMVPLNADVDVAVIDEIQMMGDSERGWAWTQAFLGVKAKEVHLCGELRTEEIITNMCKLTGDKLVVHKYERLSPLKAETKSLRGDLKNLEKGDAVILFSRVAIHAMKADIEKVTGKRCAVVYGSLPPETRAQQAALFNDPDNEYDFLVASDAVGMGLNLAIKRIIFEATSKHDGVGFRLLQTSQLKQIAGRAGRYKTAHDAIKSGPNAAEATEATEAKPLLQLDLETLGLAKKKTENVGLVTTLEKFDLPIVQRALETEVEPLKTAGLFPPSDILVRFANYFPPKTPFSYIILRLHELSMVNPMFHICKLKEQVQIADLIQPYDLSIMDRVIFMSAPVALREPGFTDVVQEFARCISTQSGGELLDLKSVELELLDIEPHDHPSGSKTYLRLIETLHKALTLYLWLSYRFAGVFRTQGLAFHAKSLVEERIDKCLADVHWDEKKRRQLMYLRQRALRKEAQQASTLDEAREEAAGGDEARDESANELLLKEETSEVERRMGDEDAEIERREDELSSEEEPDTFATKAASGEGYVDELEVEFEAETRKAETREKEGLEPAALFDGQADETDAREEDGSDADETFEDQAVDMDEVAKLKSFADVPIPPPQTNEGTKSDAIIP
jgi:ATP-dependent RNA helicase SUPV3L1/SUV3